MVSGAHPNLLPSQLKRSDHLGASWVQRVAQRGQAQDFALNGHGNLESSRCAI